MDVLIRFTGQSADEHHLPAFEGSQSLEGLSRVLVLVSHYVATGTVSKLYPFDERIKVYLKANQPGSFYSLLDIFTQPDTVLTTTALGTIALGAVGSVVIELAKLLVRRVTGQADENPSANVTALVEARSGDVAALEEAIEPAVVMAHLVVNNGAGNIVMVTGGPNVFTLNARTKQYVTTKVEDNQIRQKRVSVGMLNANTRNGRVYDLELGRTVAIHVPADAEARALNNLALSLQRYSARFLREQDSQVTFGKRAHKMKLLSVIPALTPV